MSKNYEDVDDQEDSEKINVDAIIRHIVDCNETLGIRKKDYRKVKLPNEIKNMAVVRRYK